jgi:hypothetical protein
MLASIFGRSHAAPGNGDAEAPAEPEQPAVDLMAGVRSVRLNRCTLIGGTDGFSFALEMLGQFVPGAEIAQLAQTRFAELNERMTEARNRWLAESAELSSWRSVQAKLAEAQAGIAAAEQRVADLAARIELQLRADEEPTELECQQQNQRAELLVLQDRAGVLSKIEAERQRAAAASLASTIQAAKAELAKEAAERLATAERELFQACVVPVLLYQAARVASIHTGTPDVWKHLAELPK